MRVRYKPSGEIYEAFIRRHPDTDRWGYSPKQYPNLWHPKKHIEELAEEEPQEVSNKIELDGLTADRITVDNLKYSRGLMTQSVENPKTHPQDVVIEKMRIHAIDILLDYFGDKR